MSEHEIDGLRVERNRLLAELAESQAMNARLARELAVASREIDRLEDEVASLREANVRIQESQERVHGAVAGEMNACPPRELERHTHGGVD